MPKSMHNLANFGRYGYRANKNGSRLQISRGHNLVPHIGMMAPPNANGELHLGHTYVALSEDVWARLNQLQGQDSHIITGADHGGHSLIMVVKKEQISDQFTFLEKCYRVFNHYKPMIFDTLDHLRTQFVLEDYNYTISETHCNLVMQVFADLYNKKYVTRKRIPTNWCPNCRTIVPNIEAKLSFTRVHAYVLKLYGEHGEEFHLQTEEPEMLLGNSFAIADHEMGEISRLQHPLRPNEWIPVISEAKASKLRKGFLYWPESNLEAYQIANRNGWKTIVTDFYTLEDRLDARDRVVEELMGVNAYLRTEVENVRIYRCHCGTKLVTLPLEQWTLDLAKVQQDLNIHLETSKIVPHYAQNEWSEKVENFVGDWTLSRQQEWGIRPPAYQCQQCQQWCVSLVSLNTCPNCQGVVTQDPDVLDVWFICNIGMVSWGQDLRRSCCQSILSSMSTGADTFGLLFVRSELLSRLLTGKSLSERVAILPLLVDERGRKLSKSQGNAKPVNEYLEEWGSDILRLSLLRAHSYRGKVVFTQNLFIHSRNFLQKLWSLKNFFLISEKQADAENPMTTIDWLVWHSLFHEVNSAQEYMYEAAKQANFKEAVQKMEEITRKTFSKLIIPYLQVRREQGDFSRLVWYKFRNLYLQWVRCVWAFAPDIALNIFEELEVDFENFTVEDEDGYQDDLLDFNELNEFLDRARAKSELLLPSEREKQWSNLIPLFNTAIQK